MARSALQSYDKMSDGQLMLTDAKLALALIFERNFEDITYGYSTAPCDRKCLAIHAKA